jgi:hypothetical protein
MVAQDAADAGCCPTRYSESVNGAAKYGMSAPAPLQSKTTMEGLPIHRLKSATLSGI